MVGAGLEIRNAIARQGLKPLATVVEDARATDAVFILADAQHLVVRHVHQVAAQDYRALATMLAQGDFARAAIVYTDEHQPHLTGEIEAFHISRINELAASLARESAQ